MFKIASTIVGVDGQLGLLAPVHLRYLDTHSHPPKEGKEVSFLFWAYEIRMKTKFAGPQINARTIGCLDKKRVGRRKFDFGWSDGNLN